MLFTMLFITIVASLLLAFEKERQRKAKHRAATACLLHQIRQHSLLR